MEKARDKPYGMFILALILADFRQLKFQNWRHLAMLRLQAASCLSGSGADPAAVSLLDAPFSNKARLGRGNLR